MKSFLANLGIGVALAIGAMCTLFSVVLAMRGDADSMLLAFVFGLVGIPTLFVTLVTQSRKRMPEPR